MSVGAPPRERQVVIYIGDVHASREPTTIRTTLGSCISACLWDPETAVGGMNHFMLPRGLGEAGIDSARFGVHAMDLLIGEIMKSGGDRRRLRAKIFGGAHVLDLADGHDTVPRQNVRFIRQFLAADGIPIVGEDLGGDAPRQVIFHTATGGAWVKRVPSARVQQEVLKRERVAAAPAPAPNYGEVTLF